MSLPYTAEQITLITEHYQAGVSLEEIAEQTGRTVPMIRSKLVAEKVYVAKAAVRKTASGAKTVRKIELVSEIVELTGIDALESFEKATKQDLQSLLTFLQA
jgi:hypothetical protein|tara:strand:- start:592 stop:897 length:306 start_codon:yes stop_codon:yes gene_type:complete